MQHGSDSRDEQRWRQTQDMLRSSVLFFCCCVTCRGVLVGAPPPYPIPCKDAVMVVYLG